MKWRATDVADSPGVGRAVAHQELAKKRCDDRAFCPQAFSRPRRLKGGRWGLAAGFLRFFSVALLTRRTSWSEELIRRIKTSLIPISDN